MEYFNTLPVEITLDILSRLPTELLLNCKLVCTTWRSLIRHPSFSRMQLHHLIHPPATDSGKLSFIAETKIGVNDEQFYYFEYNENHDSPTTPIERIRRIKFTPPFDSLCITFIGSCNGLICLSPNPCNEKQILRSVYICNPISIMLPEIRKNEDCSDNNLYTCWRSEFGYVSATNEYKVLGMYMYKGQYVELYIYTLGSGLGWRNLGKFNSEFKNIFHRDQATFVNGAFYWMGSNLNILTFDLAEEKFREHLSPPPLSPDSYYNGIGVLDGFLFLAIRLGGEAAEWFEIWLLKKKNDNHDMKEREEHHSLSWTKEFRVEKSKLLAVTKSGGLLTYFSNYLNIYNIEASTSIRLVDFEERLRQVFPHMNTLVSLKELGKGDAKIMESAEIGNQPASTSASQPALGG